MKTLTALTKFVIAFVLTVVAVELYLRTSEISLPSIVVNDARMGTAYRPDARAILLQEGFYMGAINPYGYLDKGYPPERTSGKLRIAVVGDSYVQAFQVFPEYNFRSILAARLSELTGDEVEVLGFGRPGQDLRTMYIYHEEFVQKFQPDISLFIVSGSDFWSKDNDLGPECYLDEDDLQISYDFAESDAYLRKVRFDIVRKFAAYSMLQNAVARYRAGDTAEIILDKLCPPALAKAHGGGAPAQAEARDRYVDLNAAVLEALARINASGRAHIVLVNRNALPAYYDPTIRSLELPVIDLDQQLLKLEATGHNPYYWPATNQTGHWNHLAHQWVGDYLAAQLFAYIEKRR